MPQRGVARLGVRAQGLPSLEKRKKIMALRSQGLSIITISEQLRLPQSTVGYHWRMGMKTLHDSVKIDAEAIFAQEGERLEKDRSFTHDIQEKLEKLIARLDPHLIREVVKQVMVGKDRNGLPKYKEVRYSVVDARAVEQYRMAIEGLTGLIQTRIRLAERMAKLVGLDKGDWGKPGDGGGNETSPFMEVLVRVWEARKARTAAKALESSGGVIEGQSERVETSEEKIKRLLNEEPKANGHQDPQ